MIVQANKRMKITLEEYRELQKPKHKYFAKRTEIDGIWFDSAREAARYRELKILERIGTIKQLELQPVYPLEVNGQLIANYVADFQYKEFGRLVTEDVKGCKTPVYRLKRKLFRAIYGREITEIV